MLVQEDVQVILTALQQTTADVDILLTREWPAGISRGTPPGSLPQDCPTSGTGVCRLRLYDSKDAADAC